MNSASLQRRLGLAAVAAIVAGDMLGSGIFFAPGELAAVARANWQIYFFWALAGVIVLCGALTLAELTVHLPKAGATFHIIHEGFGPFWAFIKIWVEMFISGPGSVAGGAILFGEFLTYFIQISPVLAGTAGILFFTMINLLGVQWGGRTQIAITSIKIAAVLALILGSIFLAEPVKHTTVVSTESHTTFLSLFILIGSGIAAVLFTYDGWTDVTHVAGEVLHPQKNIPRSLLLGVGAIIVLYLLVNYAFLRVVPLEVMKHSTNRVASIFAVNTFGSGGAGYLQAMIIISTLGAMGGLIMTQPRLYFAAAEMYREKSPLFRMLAGISTTGVPAASIIFTAAVSILALSFFGSFSRIVNFFVVPMQFINILMVASIFKLRKKSDAGYRTPLFPYVPLLFIVVMAGFIISALIYHPLDTLIGVALTATGVPFYFRIHRKEMEKIT
ncbi:MAG TPA: amino acid permease [Acidobacteriota bacterium]|jgi:APA family basic amino acid/polyamine antiporter